MRTIAEVDQWKAEFSLVRMTDWRKEDRLLAGLKAQ
jgi:hypothetical protein